MSGLFDERNTLASLLRYGQSSSSTGGLVGGILTRQQAQPVPSGLRGIATNSLLFAGLAAGSPPTNTLLGLAGGLATQPPVVPPAPPMWVHLTQRMVRFLANIEITAKQREDGETKAAGIIGCLNRHYYGISSDADNGMLIGSWGKHTWVRPPRDVDLLYLLPASVYFRFQERSGNKQSQLLQEVKSVLERTYWATEMRGDGQVVLVPFASTPVEVAVGFRCQDGSIIVPDTNNGGRYTKSTAEAELAALTAADAACNGNARVLARMIKCWQRECNVPLKSFQIERLAVEFVSQWASRMNGPLWYDWMIRDFLAYLIGRAKGYLSMPGTGELVALGDEWLSRAQTAYRKAQHACDAEKANDEYLAGLYWQDIFGTLIPAWVS